METMIWIIGGIMILAGLGLIVRLAKEKNKRKIFKKYQEIEILKKIKKDTPEEELDEISKIFKSFIKQEYGINEKLSLGEISTELEKRNEQKLNEVCSNIKKYYYLDKKRTFEKNEAIKNKIIGSIKKRRKNKELELKQKEKKATFLERINNQEKELKEKLRIQKSINTKLKK